MASKVFYIVVASAGIAVASGAAWWLQKAPAKPGNPSAAVAPAQGPGPAGGNNQPVTVEATSVRVTRLADEVQAVGSLSSRQSVTLRPEVSGRVTQLNFRDGERVRRGQVMAQLDDQLAQAQVQQSVAELSIAQANHKRNQELVAQGFISQRSVDESAAALQVAQAKLSLAQATAQRLRIVAPFDGVAGIRSVNVGEYLKDGADIVNIEDLDVMLLDFRLPERVQARVKPGQVAKVVLDAVPGAQFAAVVQAINPQIDADGRSVAVRACIDNRKLTLRPGMFARVTAVFAQRENALVVPEEAIVPQGDGAYVLKVVPGKEPASQVTARADVTLGLRGAGFVEVLTGLAANDVVVTAGQQRIRRDGTPVKVVTLGQPDAASPAQGGAAPAAPLPSASSAPAAAAPAALLVSAPQVEAGNPCLTSAQRPAAVRSRTPT